MAGQTPEFDEAKGVRTGIITGRHGKKEPSIEKATSSFFSGIGFLVAALFVCFYFPAGFTWGWAFLFPAFALIGEGVGQYLRLKEQQRQQYLPSRPDNRPVVYPAPPVVPSAIPPVVPSAIMDAPLAAPAISAPATSELAKPSSVTEHTTRHLETPHPQE
jgi:hypothetical protein